MSRASISYKLLWFSLFMLAYLVLYQWPNVAPIFAPQMLPLLPIDHWIPFVPWTFALYTSDYILVALSLILVSRVKDYDSYTRMAFTALVINGAFFIFFPTTYPRPEYPTDVGSIIGALMQLIQTTDTPNNCFPSNHVALTGVATWAVRAVSKRVHYTFALWMSAICVSTLTTKQHYFVDVLAGLAVVVTAVLLEEKVYRPLVLARSRSNVEQTPSVL